MSLAPNETPDWFRDPEPHFRTAAFWFWHRLPTDAEIGDQLADMQAKGIATVMIQARPALARTDYLAPSYLAACRRAGEEARRLGLTLTLYDEYGWMSGHGGGRTVEGADHLRERHLFWASGAADGGDLTISGIHAPFFGFLGQLGRDWLYEGGAPRWGDWRSILVVAHPAEIADAGDIRVLAPAEIEPTGPDACRIRLSDTDMLPEGWQVTVFASARCLTSRLINYLLPEAAARFAATTHAPLLAALGDAVDAAFFDHPHAGFYVWNERGDGAPGTLGNSLPCDGTPAEPGQAAALLALTRDVGPQTARLRADHLRAHGERLHEAFFGTLSRWTRAQGLGLTGHELLTHVGGWALAGDLKGFDPRTMPGLDYFGIDAFRTETTVDAADYRPQIAARFGDSVARAHGRRRCSLEQYATGREIGLPSLAGQWSLTPARFRRQAMRHILAGARRIVLHAVNVTDGFDDDERLLLNPRFDFPPAFNFEPWWEECPALFTELARLSAFLEEGEPVRPVALFYPLHTRRAEGPAHVSGEVFGRWAQALDEAGIGYGIVDESNLADTLAADTGYRVLVLPAVTLFAEAATADLIASFISRGGQAILSGSDGDAASGLAVSRMSGTAEAIRDWVARMQRPLPDIRFADAEPMRCTVLRVGEEWRIAVLNERPQPRSLHVTLPQPELMAESWCPRTGTRARLPDAGDGAELRLTLPGEAILCLSLRPADGTAAPPPVEAVDTVLHTQILAEGWSLEVTGQPPVPIRVDRGWEAQGFARFSGTGLYRCTVERPIIAGAVRWRLRLPRVHETAELWVNGVHLGTHLAGAAVFDLPADLAQPLMVELRVRNTAANRYYGGTAYESGSMPSGLTAPPELEALAPA